MRAEALGGPRPGDPALPGPGRLGAGGHRERPPVGARAATTAGSTGRGSAAVVVNAGTANAATGSPGLEDARAMAARAAARLGLDPGEVAVSSTGTIGDRIDMDMVGSGHRRGGRGPVGRRAAPTSTWPSAPPTARRRAGPSAWRSGGREVTIGAAAKGAGMIRPSMATMLAYVTTDARRRRRGPPGDDGRRGGRLVQPHQRRRPDEPLRHPAGDGGAATARRSPAATAIASRTAWRPSAAGWRSRWSRTARGPTTPCAWW